MIENPSSTENAGPLVAAEVAQTQTPEYRFQRDAAGHLVFVDSNGQSHIGVTTLRLFPLTAPDEWISVFNQEGQELACIAELSQLAPEDRELLSDDLKSREFVPEILRVRSISGNYDPKSVGSRYGPRSHSFHLERRKGHSPAWTFTDTDLRCPRHSLHGPPTAVFRFSESTYH